MAAVRFPLEPWPWRWARECIDFRIDVNGIILLARSHPSVRTPVGGSIYVSIDPAKCAIVVHADSA